MGARCARVTISDGDKVRKGDHKVWDKVHRGDRVYNRGVLRAVHKVCARPYPNYIVVPSINNDEPCCPFI